MYPYDKHCWECGNEWNSKEYGPYGNVNICPDCGADTRNPIHFFYKENLRNDIKENIRDINWIKNVDIKFLIKEKIFREKKVEHLENQTKAEVKFLEYYDINKDDEIVRYFEEKYGIYDPSILDIKFEDVAREIELIRPLPRDARQHLASHTISVGLKALSKHRLNELYESMKQREDKGIDIDFEIELLKRRYSHDLEFELKLSCNKLSESELKKVQNEKINEMNEDMDKIKFKIITDLEEGSIENFNGLYPTISSSINIQDYIPCNRWDI